MENLEKNTLRNVINQIRIIKGYNIPYKDFAEALSIQTSSVNKRLARNSLVSENDIKLLKKYFGIDKLSEGLNNQNYFELKYYENENLTKLIRNPLINYISMDYNIVKVWRLDPNDLRIIAMPGDKMEASPTHHTCIRNGDILLIDTSSKDINISGIYAYETLGGTKLQISHVAVMTNSNVRFYYANDMYPDEVRTEQDLKNLDFKVIGRILKNLSFVYK